ncbi:ustiloxin B cluster transcription factor ustR [Cladobotryum mycophilum]|uniref:Ustiloxin B cluster transcription factor ustR n=1 Tax=Cladobotryum mycophilum TaxID=491253 RepID=A0ABR0SXS6_9HYPO
MVCHVRTDRGHKEQEEADKLQLHRRTHTRRHSDAVSRSIPCQSPSIAFASPPEIYSSSLPQSGSLSSLLSSNHSVPSSFPPLDTSALLTDFWAPDFDELASTPTFYDASVGALENNTEILPNTCAAGITPLYSSTKALDFSSAARVTPSEEREIELMMQFLGEDFAKQHPSYQSSAMTERSWLMCIFKRSSTFFYASLGTSAYLNFLRAPEHDGRRTASFREYDRYRDIATKGHLGLLEATRQECLQPPADFMLGETIICSVQLAILESLGENYNATLSHLDSASLALVKYCEIVSLTGASHPPSETQIGAAFHPQPSILPAASVMERRALEFFTCTLIWMHILHCSTQQAMPLATSLYRRLLSANSPFGSFVEIVGLEGWVLVALMDAIDVSVWKREQEAKNRLSMRELISKTDAIVSSISKRVQQSDHVQTHVFAHAITIHIHTITSGHLPAVPEIQQTLDKAIPLWQELSPSLDNLKRLSWAFCVSASLASGAQRVVFDKVLSDAASTDPLSRTVVCLRALVDECWKILDAGAPSCNWETVMRKLGHSVHGTLFV